MTKNGLFQQQIDECIIRTSDTILSTAKISTKKIIKKSQKNSSQLKNKKELRVNVK